MKEKISIQVQPDFLAEQSDPENDKYFFTYKITIANESDRQAQLMRRKWLIIDSDDTRQEVEGEGVVGQQPKLSPGEKFTYTSGVMIETPVGTMQGSFFLVDEGGSTHEVPIKPFLLAVPGLIH